jgi:small acid-soluble spore protein H (minor)
MNVGRAKEILDSSEMINVSYEGEAVIIQNVDEQSKIARIYSKQNPDQEMDVPVLNLIEE